MFRAAISLTLALAFLATPGMCCCTAALFAKAVKPVAADSDCCRKCCPRTVEVPACCRHESKHEKPAPKPTCCECCVKPQLAPVADALEIEKPEPALLGFLPRPISETVHGLSSVEPSRPPPLLSMKRFIEDFCHILRC